MQQKLRFLIFLSIFVYIFNFYALYATLCCIKKTALSRPFAFTFFFILYKVFINIFRSIMKQIALFFAVIAATLTLEACASSDPRGHQPIEIGNTANETQMVREGRDTQTYMMSTMPTPSNAESTYMGKMPEAKVHYEEKEDIKVDDKLDYKKIDRN